MKSEQEVEAFAHELINKGALSVFLYGLRATCDALKDSDWEIGAIFDDSKYVSRSELASLYLFSIKSLSSGDITSFGAAISIY